MATKEAAAGALVCCMVAVTCTIAVVDLGLSIAEITMGAIHLKDCPVQTKIPIYLVVAGCTGIILAVSNLVKAKKSKSESQRREAAQQSKAAMCANSIISLLSLFAFAWLICGTVWVFGVRPNFEQPNNGTEIAASPQLSAGNGTMSTYCYEPLYKFAMATVLLRYAVMMLYFFIILCTCCACCGAIIGFMCCTKCLASKEDGAASGEQREQAVNMMEKS